MYRLENGPRHGEWRDGDEPEQSRDQVGWYVFHDYENEDDEATRVAVYVWRENWIPYSENSEEGERAGDRDGTAPDSRSGEPAV